MKKLFLTLVVILASVSVFAQNSTKMGADHKWTVGASLTHAFYETLVDGKDVNNAGFMAFERNSMDTNYRTRVTLGWLDRTHVCPTASVDAQYLFPIGQTGLFVYPSVGAYCETFRKHFNVGAQAAAGLEYQFSSRFGIFAEATCQHLFLNGGINRFHTGLGFKVAFGK